MALVRAAASGTKLEVAPSTSGWPSTTLDTTVATTAIVGGRSTKSELSRPEASMAAARKDIGSIVVLLETTPSETALKDIARALWLSSWRESSARYSHAADSACPLRERRRAETTATEHES